MYNWASTYSRSISSGTILAGGSEEKQNAKEDGLNDDSDVSLHSDEETVKVLPVKVDEKKRKAEDTPTKPSEKEGPSKPKKSKHSFVPRHY